MEDRSNRHIWDPLRAKREPTAFHRGLEMEVKESPGSVSFAVRVSPRVSRYAIEGERSGALKIRLTAPAVEDRANDSLRRLWRSGWRSRSPLLESWRAKRVEASAWRLQA